MKKTKIDWCDSTINPVMGCPNGCTYCYARKLNTRFKWIEDWNKPQFFPERLKDFYSKMPKSIFIDSMSDIGTWKQEWLESVLLAMWENPQHNYIALTKTDTNILLEKCLEIAINKFNDLNGCLHIGKSVTTQKQLKETRYAGKFLDFLSIEPILEPLDFTDIFMPKTFIIGAETGNRKGKVIPQKKWIDDIVKVCNVKGVKVFMKESLRKIMGDDFRQDKLPWEINQ